MARDRSVLVRLRASVSEFTGPLKDAKRAVDDISTGTKDAQRGLAQHARENREAWTQVGGALTAYGAAVTGIGAAVLGVGISYNTLRQQSVAALTTLTGSAEAANAQMDKLDDFASNSPFARDVFIKAQQQLIGFGMEAEKVIPTLDAIQNAVAATGGSNQDIEELVRIIAQVGAAGKITATDLMQFGQRGVDAATLIGSQMGLTGQEIREKITAGTLDADAAIQALTDGMNERFGGAAENVKGTMLGAADRVKAAFRDISASFASVLVDPQGGGLLVDGLNSLADGMRAFEGLPTPIRNTAVALGLISGPAALAAGGFLLLAPRAVETWDALGKMGRVGETAQAALRRIGRHAPTAAAGLGLIAAGYAGIKAVGEIATSDLGAAGVEELTSAVLDFRDAGDPASLDAIFASFQSGQGKVTDLASAADLLVNPTWRDNIQGLGDSIFGLEQEAALAEDAFASLGGILAGMVTGGDVDGAAATFEHLYGQMDQSKISAEQFMALMPAYGEALAGVDNDARLAAGGMGELNGAAQSAADALALIKAGPLQEAAAGIVDSLGDLYDSLITMDGINDAELSLDGWLTKVEAELDAAANAFKNRSYLIGEGVSAEFIDGILAQDGGDVRVQQMADAVADDIDAGVTDNVDRYNAAGERIYGAQRDGIVNAAAADSPIVIAAELELGMGKSALQAEADALFYNDPLAVPVDGDPEPLRQTVSDTILWAAELNGIVHFDADGSLAFVKIDEWNTAAANTTGMPLLDANPDRARQQLAEWYGDAVDTTGTAILDANARPALGATDAWWYDAENTSATADLYANTSSAYAALWAFARAAANTSVSIGLSASGGRAYGGYTGPGSKFQEAGVVHADEFVHTKENLAKPGMLSFHTDLWQTNDLDGAYQRHKLRGYDGGGPVGMAPAWSAPVPQIAAAAPAGETSAIAAAISSAMQSWRPMVELDGRQFYGAMVDASTRYESRTGVR